MMWFSDIQSDLMLRPQWQRQGLLFVLLGLLFVLVALLWLQPRQQNISDLKQQILVAENMLVLTHKQIADMPARADIEREWQSIANKTSGYLQVKEAIPTLTDAIIQEVVRSGVRLNDLKYLTAVQQDGFIIYQWQLDVDASYYPLITLIQRWTTAPQLYVISEWSLRQNADQLSLSMMLNQYQIKEDLQ